MKVHRSDNVFRPDRYVADAAGQPRRQRREFTKPVVFRYADREARQVCVVGSFNNWNPSAHPLERLTDGTWQLVLELPLGHHEFYLLVDGRRVLDPSRGTVSDGRGGRHNLVSVT